MGSLDPELKGPSLELLRLVSLCPEEARPNRRVLDRLHGDARLVGKCVKRLPEGYESLFPCDEKGGERSFSPLWEVLIMITHLSHQSILNFTPFFILKLPL